MTSPLSKDRPYLTEKNQDFSGRPIDQARASCGGRHSLSRSCSLEELYANTSRSCSPLKGRMSLCETVPEMDETEEVQSPKTSASVSSGSRSRKSSHSDHIREVTKLFDSSASLKRVSGEHPLSPFSPRASASSIENNANDVYMPENLEVVFKPGLVAAMKSKLCFGLTQLFVQLEKVIVAAKEGQATVISREDYETERVKIYNPEAQQAYLCEKDLLRDKFVVDNKKAHANGVLEGVAAHRQVKLLPVEGRAGFYLMCESSAMKEGKSKGSLSGKSDDWGTHSDSWEESSIEWDDSSSCSDHALFTNNILLAEDEEIEQITHRLVGGKGGISAGGSEESISENVFENRYVMHISTMPGKIDALVQSGGPWAVVDKGSQSYLVPVEEIIPVSTENECHMVRIGEVLYALSVFDNGSFRVFPDDIPLDMPLRGSEQIARKYALLMHAYQKVLVPKTVCVAFDKSTNTVRSDNKTYRVQRQANGFFELKAAHVKGEDAFIFVEDDWLAEDIITTKFGKDYVRRNDQDYRVKENNGTLKVIGKNIHGMVQLKVQNIFQKPEGAAAALSLLEPSHARESFYSRIDMQSFIHAFITTIILRPQDGKVDDLGESNVLFQAIPNEEGVQDPSTATCQLRPMIIDLDEMMPPANDFQAEGICALRNGLMGFPQARQKLDKENTQLVLDVLREIVAKKHEANEFLKRFTGRGNSCEFNQTHIDAYNETIERLSAFVSQYDGLEWALQELFFFVFPEYQRQWDALGALSPERKAQYIGRNTLEDSLKLGKRYSEEILTGTKFK